MSRFSDTALREFGKRVHSHRIEAGMSIRKLASLVGVSPAYISSIEHGNNPSTGRPPVPSAPVLHRLSTTLDIRIHQLQGLFSSDDGQAASANNHALIYLLDPAPADVLAVAESQYGSEVDHWLYIPDPRDGHIEAQGAGLTVERWSLRHYPYDERILVTQKLLDALSATIEALSKRLASDAAVGLIIADCSAVMRWVDNSEDEIRLEKTWHAHVSEIWQRHFNDEPAFNVCVYRHEDLQALGVTIDQLGSALTLISEHDQLTVADNKEVLTGAAGARRILTEHRPSGVTERAWSTLITKAANSIY